MNFFVSETIEIGNYYSFGISSIYMSNNYQFFEEESQKYEQILLEFSNNPNAEPFVDENFHPFKKIDEKKIGDDLSDSYKWERIDKIYPAPLFKKELIHPYFIEQGAIGDCYLITSLSRIAKQPYLVQTLFEKKKARYHLRRNPRFNQSQMRSCCYIFFCIWTEDSSFNRYTNTSQLWGLHI